MRLILKKIHICGSRGVQNYNSQHAQREENTKARLSQSRRRLGERLGTHPCCRFRSLLRRRRSHVFPAELRALRYVQRGDVLRLKSYLRRHRALRLDRPMPGGRSLLHVACAPPADACALLLLRRGADPLGADGAGDNALHVAAREVERGGRRVHTDLVVPLLRRCPQAMDAPNLQGNTPRDILRRAEALMQEDPPEATPAVSYPDPSSPGGSDWQWKLLSEGLDEYQEAFGQYDGDFSEPPPEEETFESWSDRISQEHRARQRRAAGPRIRRAPTGASSAEMEEQRYRERQRQMEQELRQARKERYQGRCQAVFGREGTRAGAGTEQAAGRAREAGAEAGGGGIGRDAGSEAAHGGARLLGYSDIPWPVPGGTAEQMAQAIAAGADPLEADSYRRYLRAQRVTWHPDRFLQRCGGRLRGGDRDRVLRTVTSLSQELNRLAERTQ
ncbi:LOW QUALITY PROTEIN: NF-kappa-B inhibitor-like protein 1 [Ascaphus truei]|uniref:LOW QUALITY PROTEIN: NF-kappa-B inhibitor-like protein 1 n=1 Tax=Ascaphus truei TaxID=8439 RepID=UPI003F5A4B1A